MFFKTKKQLGTKSVSHVFRVLINFIKRKQFKKIVTQVFKMSFKGIKFKDKNKKKTRYEKK